MQRADPSTLAIDIVRIAFASPDNANAAEAAARAKLAQLVDQWRKFMQK